MSQGTDTPWQIQQWRDALTVQISAVLVLALLLMPMLVPAEPFWARPLYALFIVLAVWRVSSVILLIGAVVYLVIAEPSWQQHPSMLVVAVTVAASVLVFVLVSRIHAGRAIVEVISRTMATDEAGAPATTDSASPAIPARTVHRGGSARPAWIQPAGSVARLGATVVLSMLVAWIVLSGIPEDTTARQTFRLRPVELRAITVAMVLFGTYAVLSAVVSALRSREWSQQQARIYLRSAMVEWLERDLRMVIRRRGQNRSRGGGSRQRIKGDITFSATERRRWWKPFRILRYFRGATGDTRKVNEAQQ